MTQIERHNLIGASYISKEVVDERKEIYVINDELPEEFQQAIKDIQFKLNDSTGTFELDYPIMNDACHAVAEIELKELKDYDFYENPEYASVYTGNRLSYLNLYNQEDISDVMRGGYEDIATACAVWYDRQVATACEMIRDYILQ